MTTNTIMVMCMEIRTDVTSTATAMAITSTARRMLRGITATRAMCMGTHTAATSTADRTATMSTAAYTMRDAGGDDYEISTMLDAWIRRWPWFGNWLSQSR